VDFDRNGGRMVIGRGYGGPGRAMNASKSWGVRPLRRARELGVEWLDEEPWMSTQLDYLKRGASGTGRNRILPAAVEGWSGYVVTSKRWPVGSEMTSWQ